MTPPYRYHPLNDIFPNRLGHGGCVSINLQLVVDTSNVRIHGVEADAQLIRNLFLYKAISHQTENIDFTLRQLVVRRPFNGIQ